MSEEMANHSQVEDVILPDDFTPETAEPEVTHESTEQQESTATQAEEVTEQSQEPRKLKVKYNHEEVELGEDEAVPLIQKGMNYDKLQEKFNAIQNDPRLGKYEKIQKLGELYGYQSDDDLIDDLYNNYFETAAQRQGLTPEQIRREHEISQRESALNQKEQGITEKQKNEAMYDRFLEAFPGVTEKDIKPETWAKVQNGMDLTAAYVEQRNQELESRLKVLEQNEKNNKAAPVNGATTHGSSETASQDPFLQGFDSI